MRRGGERMNISAYLDRIILYLLATSYFKLYEITYWWFPSLLIIFVFWDIYDDYKKDKQKVARDK